MGNRAVITASTADNVQEAQDIGVYLHWNGGRNTVEALLAYCEAKGYRKPDKDNYGWARLCQVAGNMLGDTLSLGVDRCDNLDCDNHDNGTYIIGGYSGWSIIDRKYFPNGIEQGADDSVTELYEIMQYINERQPRAEWLDDDVLAFFAVKHYNEWHDTEVVWKPVPKDKKLPMEWIPVSERLPQNTGNVVCITANGYVQTLHYSSHHKVFNCHDYEKEPQFEIKVAYWMPVEALPEVKQEEDD